MILTWDLGDQNIWSEMKLAIKILILNEKGDLFKIVK